MINEKEKKEICNRCDISYVCDYKSMPDCKDLKEKKEIDLLASDIDYAITSRDISLEDRREIAKALVLLGYGKVEYGLDTKQEKQQAVDKEYTLKTTQNGYLSVFFDIVRKQAIKEFSEKLRDKLGYCDKDYEICYSFFQEDLDKLLKEYGV